MSNSDIAIPIRELPESGVRLFWRRVETPAQGCWKWSGTKDIRGYARLRVGERRMAGHRVSWVIHYGPIPRGALILHHCDNPECTNPEHLFIGDDADNMADMVAKGRHVETQIGEACVNAKLNPEKVREIRASTETYRKMAKRYGVSRFTIQAIRNRDTWRHVE